MLCLLCIEDSIAAFFDRIATIDLLIIDNFGIEKLVGQPLLTLSRPTHKQ